MRVIFPLISDYALKLKDDGEVLLLNDVTEFDTLQQKGSRLLPRTKKKMSGVI